MGSQAVSERPQSRSVRLYERLDRLFERPFIFNAYQAVVDGGKSRQISKFLAPVPFESVLDVGCGTGNWARFARGRYLGVDTSPSFITACRRRYSGVRDRQFLLADAAEIDASQRFDLGLMVSVLHHLSDAKAEAVLERMALICRYVFVLDLYPIPWNPLSRFLYAHDRGNFIREPAEQRDIFEGIRSLRVLKAGAYYSPTLLYRHTLFLLASSRADD